MVVRALHTDSPRVIEPVIHVPPTSNLYLLQLSGCTTGIVQMFLGVHIQHVNGSSSQLSLIECSDPMCTAVVLASVCISGQRCYLGLKIYAAAVRAVLISDAFIVFLNRDW